MTLPFSFCQNLATAVDERILLLDPEESFHVSRVLRLRKGSRLMLTNGQGYLVEGEIVEPNHQETVIRLIAEPVLQPKRNYSVHIAVAPTRHPDRLEWFVEKATESGIEKISLIVCEHSEKWNTKTARLNRIMISAMKQSRQTWIPLLQGPLPYHQFIRDCSEEGKWIAYCEGERESLAKHINKGKSGIVAIGPEGDFSPREVESALKSGFIPISLGPTRLRTETAALYACHVFHIINDL